VRSLVSNSMPKRTEMAFPMPIKSSQMRQQVGGGLVVLGFSGTTALVQRLLLAYPLIVSVVLGSR